MTQGYRGVRSRAHAAREKMDSDRQKGERGTLVSGGSARNGGERVSEQRTMPGGRRAFYPPPRRREDSTAMMPPADRVAHHLPWRGRLVLAGLLLAVLLVLTAAAPVAV